MMNFKLPIAKSKKRIANCRPLITSCKLLISNCKPLITNCTLLIAGLILALPSGGQVLPYQDPDLSSGERAEDLIGRLTLEEKASLMYDQSEAVPRLGIRKFNWWSEALHGLANNENVTVFPEPIGMAASFDDALVYRVFDAVSDETRAKYNESQREGQENRRFLSLSVYTPNVNIFRDPRWGRGQETYGEDPYLTSRMGISVVRGLQGPDEARYRKLLACAKHYAVHSGPEWSRHTLNITDLSPRDLHETYLPAFKALVQEAGVREVMCAYQRLDDEPCCGSTRLLQRILRDDWGFKYLVTSDCDAVSDFVHNHKVSSDEEHAAAKAVRAGTDLECVWQNNLYKTLPDAVNQGLLREEDIDRSLKRLLVGRFDLGEMDPDSLVPWTRIPMSVVNNEAHRQMALEMARETMTLLQNNDHILPLKKSVKKIAVLGPNAHNRPMLWGNYNGIPVRTVTILEGIRSKVPPKRILYDPACDLVQDKVIETYFRKCSIDGKAGFRVSWWNSPDRSGKVVKTEQIADPVNLTLTDQRELVPGLKPVGFSAAYETEFTPAESGEITFRVGATGYYELLVNGDTLKRSVSWRSLPSRVPYRVEAGKTYRIELRFGQKNDWLANLEFDFGKEKEVDFSGLIQKLKGVDVVVFAGGLSSMLEGEEMPVSWPGFKGGDRTSIELPAAQRNCLKALKEAGKKVIFVCCSGSAIALTPETGTCEAILQAWYGGEAGGQAVADVLFGDYNPSGKLPVTFYRNTEQLGDFQDYSMEGRTYRYMDDALFPFGYGLSYTSFEIGTATLDKPAIAADGSVRITVPVSNTGGRQGTEVVQVYVRKTDDAGGALKTLRGFERIELDAGETGSVTLTLSPSSFEFYDWDQRKMAVTPGEYELYYGTSSRLEDLQMAGLTIR